MFGEVERRRLVVKHACPTCWMDNFTKWITSQPMPELLTGASCRTEWNRISAESSVRSPHPIPDDPIGQGTEPNWTELFATNDSLVRGTNELVCPGGLPSDTVVREWDKTYSCYGRRQTSTSPLGSVSCLMRTMHARFLSDTTLCPMSKSVCRASPDPLSD